MSVKEIVDIGCSVCVQTCMCDVLRIQHGKAEIIHPDDVRRASYVNIDCPRSAVLVILPNLAVT